MSTLTGKTSFETLTGRVIRTIRRLRSDSCIQILAYHSVSSRASVLTDGTSLRHDPTEFERHLDYLLAHYKPLRLSEVIERYEQGESLERSFVITLDDGFADALHTAGAILYRRRVPATIYPVTSVVGNADLMWQHKLTWLVANNLGDQVVDAMTSVGVETRKENESIEAFARRCYFPAIPDLLECVLNRAGQSGRDIAGKLRPYLEPEEIARAEPELFEFGNHTHHHAILSALTEAQQRTEIEKARDCIRDLTSCPPVSLAYPFGLKRHYSVATKRIAVETGHRALLDTRRRMNLSGQTPLTELSRKPAPVGLQADFEMLVEDWPANTRMD